MAEAPFDAAAVRKIAERTGEPGWFTDRRLEALNRFDALPWPDPSAEAWRYTKLDGFDLTAFTPDDEAGGALDGLATEAQGVVFTTLEQAAAEHPDLVRDVLGSAGVSESDEKFATLAAALGSGGVFCYVPAGKEVPAQLRRAGGSPAAGGAALARSVVVVEEGGSVTVVDRYDGGPADAGPADAGGLSISSVEIHAHQSSNVSYLAVQDWAPTVWHFNIQRAIVQRDATLRSLAATLGGRMSRSVVETILDGQGAYSEMLGVYFADTHQHFDHRSLQEHRAPATKSDLYYKGALKGHSTAVYSGLIHIAKEAQQTDAWQANRNLILSEHAKADSIPYLEIEANDVRCAHGASVGPPDEDVVFYLGSRGLDAAAAERLVVKGFFQEVLDRVRVTEVREALEAAVEAELEIEE